MEKKNFLDFIFRLQEIRYKVSTGYSSQLFKLSNLCFSIDKGNTTVDKLIRFNIETDPSSLPLKAFAKVDEICEEFGIECSYTNHSFNFKFEVHK